MTRTFRRTEEQMRASVRGLNAPRGKDAAPAPVPEPEPPEPDEPDVPPPPLVQKKGRISIRRRSSAVERVKVERPVERVSAPELSGPETELIKVVPAVEAVPAAEADEAGGLEAQAPAEEAAAATVESEVVPAAEAQPDAAAPAAAQPEAAEPDAAAPAAAQPEAAQPEAAQPEAAEPALAGPEAPPVPGEAEHIPPAHEMTYLEAFLAGMPDTLAEPAELREPVHGEEQAVEVGAMVDEMALTDLPPQPGEGPVHSIPEATEPIAGAPGAGEEQPEPDVAAVSVVGAVKVYGEGANAVRAIDGVSHGFPKGRFTAIMGPSGSGKSTLLHCLAGLDDLTSGRVMIGKVNVTALDEKGKTLLRRDKVGFIFQSHNLVPTLTALENITLPMELAKREPDMNWVKYLISTVGLSDRLDHLPSELSGGQQQRVAAVRALASKPAIVFADEPTGNLDSRRSGEILQFLRTAVDEFGQTIVIVTHDPIAASYADSVVFLADGQIVEEIAGPTIDMILDRIRAIQG